MAVFNIKRGDSMPPLIASFRVAGTDPERFYDANLDDIGGILEDNALTFGTPTIKLIMTNLETGVVVGLPANVANRFTGFGEIYEKTIGFEDPPANTIPIKKTLLRYNWQQQELGFDPQSSTTSLYGGDTLVAGSYKAEFEVIFAAPAVGKEPVKRTFPATPGDTLIINVLPDDNDRSVGESV